MLKSIIVPTLWLICFVASAPDVFSQRQLKPLPLQQDLSLLSFPPLTPINMSPDGQWVAYTVQDPRRAQPLKESKFLRITRTGASPLLRGCDIWITNTKSGETKNLTAAQGTSWSPVWSPDGNYLAFYSDRNGRANIWLWEKSSRNLRRVSDEVVRSFNGFESLVWTPDSKQIVTKVIPHGMTIETLATLIEGKSTRSDSETSLNDLTLTLYKSGVDGTAPRDGTSPGDSSNVYLADLVLLNVRDGTSKRLVTKSKIVGVWLSPDGTQVAFTSINKTSSNTGLFDLSVVSLTDPLVRVVASTIPTTLGLSVSWSPDANQLSYITAKGDCFVVRTSDGVTRHVTSSSHPSFATLYRTPIWDHLGRSIYLLTRDSLWRVSLPEGLLVEVAKIPGKQLLEIISPGSGRFWSPDGGQSMYLLTRDQETKKTGFYKVDLTTGKSVGLLEEQKYFGFDPVFTIDASASRMVYVTEDAQHPPDIWIIDSDMRNPRQLTKINPHLDLYEMGASRLVEWTTVDGQRLKGAVLLPAGYQPDRRYPLIVVAYGGYYLSNYVYEFGLMEGSQENMQLFATRGYAVLLPDAPLRVGTPMQDIAKTILPGVDKVIELGIADPERIGVRGQSYGGYSTLALIVQTSRFKAAVISAAQGNLIAKYGTLSGNRALGVDWAERGQGRMGGTLWEYRDRYIENSP
ncbi:MAG TPA: prolyl oligopeptidase family serine peptidase, partial [Candidatus Saccharimonadales bacterium]|nr:prolyl oligopeptidase family serine peptidase [Candidatus Saccharimonadales bacterium]